MLPPGWVFPYISHIGMYSAIRYAPFWSENGYRRCPFWSGIGYGFPVSCGVYECI